MGTVVAAGRAGPALLSPLRTWSVPLAIDRSEYQVQRGAQAERALTARDNTRSEAVNGRSPGTAGCSLWLGAVVVTR